MAWTLSETKILPIFEYQSSYPTVNPKLRTQPETLNRFRLILAAVVVPSDLRSLLTERRTLKF